MHNLVDIRADLAGRLARLTAQMDRIENERRTPLDDDLDEQAIEREGEEALDAEQRAAGDEMKAIQHALARLDAGLYGLCTSCGIPIDAARLEALPTAAHCIECERELGI
jgi:DnaK suppressor protein